MALRCATVLALALASTAPVVAHAAPPPPTDPQHTIQVDTLTRSYYLHLPPKHDPTKPTPLVLVLHGHGGTAKAMIPSTGFDDIADREHFIVAYLQGTKGADGKSAWNSGITPELDIDANDVKFVRKLVAHLQSKHGADPRRTYVAGFSNGGFMTHRLAAQVSDLFAAVGVVAGTVGTQQDDGQWIDIAPAKAPIPIAILHGKSDDAIRYDGGTAANGHTVRSVADAVLRWTKTNGCAAKPVKKTLVPRRVVTADYADCTGDTEVLLYTFLKGEHQWPNVGNPAGISGAEELWKFFARHPESRTLATAQ